MKKIKDTLKNILPDNWLLFYHRLQADISNIAYSYPSRKLTVIGVTGTNGKTTTCHFIYQILTTAGYKTGLLTTTTLAIGKKKRSNKTRLTTFAPKELNKSLKKMVDAGCEYVVLETSSHAATQHRIRGIAFDVVAITNITREHLDYHKTFEEYREAKKQILKAPALSFKKEHIAKQVVLNRDENNFEYLNDVAAERKFSYGILRGEVMAERINYRTTACDFLAKTPVGNKRITINLPGRFNVYNALAAITVTMALAIDLETIRQGLLAVKGVPGRMEEVKPKESFLNKHNFNVIVDFAHTPDAFYQMFETIRTVKKNGLICAFGAAGERDKSKRPLLGQLAAKYCDSIVLTSEDPRSENPIKILSQIEKGALKGQQGGKFKKGKNLFLVGDREKGIKKALKIAQDGDLVMILGKGAEKTQDLKGGKIPWDDRRITKKLLEEILTKRS